MTRAHSDDRAVARAAPCPVGLRRVAPSRLADGCFAPDVRGAGPGQRRCNRIDTGPATTIVDTVPTTMPTISASAKSPRVAPPRKSSTVRIVSVEMPVFTVRGRVESTADPTNVWNGSVALRAQCSRTRSNTTTVSLTE